MTRLAQTTFVVTVTVEYDADAETHDEPEHVAQRVWLDSVPDELPFGRTFYAVITEGAVDPTGVPYKEDGSRA